MYTAAVVHGGVCTDVSEQRSEKGVFLKIKRCGARCRRRRERERANVRATLCSVCYVYPYGSHLLKGVEVDGVGGGGNGWDGWGCKGRRRVDV